MFSTQGKHCDHNNFFTFVKNLQLGYSRFFYKGDSGDNSEIGILLFILQ